MIEQGFTTAKTFGQSLLLLDRYFLSVPALKRLNELHQFQDTQMHIVTKAKKMPWHMSIPLRKRRDEGALRKKEKPSN